MSTTNILEQDRIDGENFLEQLLTDAVPNADFRKGGALRDFAVSALSSVFAYLRKEVDYVKARQSLLLLGALTGADVDAAVDEILSNWFITRKTGRVSRGIATLYFTQQMDVVIPITAKFTRSTGLIFQLDSTVDLGYSADIMTPVYSSSGVVTSYTLQIPLVSSGVGSEYNIEPGAFADFSRFNPYLSRVENAQIFSGGASTETTPEMLSRAEMAITTRNLVSARSIDAVLKEEFVDIDNLVVVGYGDPEMIRDLVEESSTRTRIHAGGFADVYVHSPVVESQTVTLRVGDVYSDLRPGYYIFRDANITDFTTAAGFVTAPVVPGDILNIWNTLTAEQDLYIVEEVYPNYLVITRRSLFPRAMPEVLESFTDGSLDNTAPGVNHLLGGASYTFSQADIGRFVRVLGSATAANNGIWQISGFNVGGNFAVIANVVPDFVDEVGVQWELIEREEIGLFTAGETLVPAPGTNRLDSNGMWTFSAEDLGRYVEISGSVNANNNGIWPITVIVGANIVTLGGVVPDFTLETGLSWKLLENDTIGATARSAHTIVGYTIGSAAPNFNNHVANAGAPIITGRMTKEVVTSGSVYLPGIPYYQITDVSFADPLNAYAPLTVGGRVTFGLRSNLTPRTPTDPADPAHALDPNYLEYQVVCHNPGEGQSGWQLTELKIGYPTDVPVGPNPAQSFDGELLQITYDTISGYESIWEYMLSSDRRIVCASVIPKALHPVYIGMNIRYSLAKGALSSLDEAAAKQALVDHLNAFPVSEDLDTTDIAAFLRTNYLQIGYIEPPVITYELIAPDGRIIYYETYDKVIIDPSKHRYPAESDKCLDDRLSQGVSNNTIRYVSTVSRITFTAI